MGIKRVILTPGQSGLPLPLPKEPKDWFGWRDRVLHHRAKMLWETSQPGKAGQVARAREIMRCKRSFIYEACTYGGIFEARPEEKEWGVIYVKEDGSSYTDEEDYDVATSSARGVLKPYIMYPFQIEVAEWLDERMRSRGQDGDGVMVKARDMGMSNEAAFWTAHNWLWKSGFQARLLSRKEDLVDRLGDPDSLFWKLEQYLMALPDWLLRAGVGTQFDWKKHRTLMRLINPRTQNLISGESTQANAGRGGRASVVILDEAAFMDDLAKIWTALRASTNHRIAISTVSIDHGMDFYNLEQGKGQDRPAVLRISYDQHPEHDHQWLEEQLSRDTEEGVRREILMDYFAGQGEYVYPETHNFTTGDYPYLPMEGPFYIAIDDGYDDHWAMLFIQYHPKTGRVRVLDAYVNHHRPADFYATLIRSQPRQDFAEAGWYGKREMDLMAWLRQMPPATVIGDTHGAQVEQIAGRSIWDHWWKEWSIVVNYDYTKRLHKDRRHATGLILPMTDFNNTIGGEYVLECFQRHRFKKVREGKDQMTEYKEPLHSESSHPVTAFEYFATQMDVARLKFKDGQKVRWVGARNRG